MSQSPLPGLYIVATPIGNLADLSPRAQTILSAADVVACEDTRVAGKLLHLFGIKRPLLRHDDHASDGERASLVARLGTQVVVLVSDAGTPLISDPGYRLVRDARAAGHMVTSVPGPCAAIAALSLSGLPTDRFLFAGFLPAKAGARTRALAELAGIKATLVFYESGPRLAASLRAMADALGPREVCVARELTKLHEEVITGQLDQLAARFAAPPKGEMVIVVAPPLEAKPATADPEAIRAALREAMASAPASRAARDVAKCFGIAREDAYAIALELSGKA
ncbi:MAG: 16S rRNA (cytidine(1402)-2'-O)-methyltransferase [Sphingopyxis sp.]